MQTKRLAPTAETIKLLLLRSGNQCAFPDCNHTIFNDQNILIAECCHIESALPGGPRYNASQDDEQRRVGSNLLFLCHRHHKETDDESIYSVAVLKAMKSEHKSKFNGSFSVQPFQIVEVQKSIIALGKQINEILDSVDQLKADQKRITEMVFSNKDEKEDIDTSSYFQAPVIEGFTGRHSELLKLESLLKSFNTIVVGGISGIGKTSLVAQFIRNSKEYKVVWIDCRILGSEEHFFSQLGAFVQYEFGNENIRRAIATNDRGVVLQLIVQAFNANNAVIVVDNLIDSLLPALRELNFYLVRSRVILLTSESFVNHTWLNSVGEMTLKGLDQESFNHLAKIYLSNTADLEIRELYGYIDGHPYLLKLTGSISRYIPLSMILNRIKGRGLGQIADYIEETVLGRLNESENIILSMLCEYKLPFRFSIGNYLQYPNFELTLKKLIESYLVEPFSGNQLYSIHDLVKRFSKLKNSIAGIRPFFNYLISIQPRFYFESEKLIELSCELCEFTIAEDVAQQYINGLMGRGEFNYVLHYTEKLLEVEDVRKWTIIYYVRGRAFRFQDNIEAALNEYQKGLDRANDAEEIDRFKFEKASMLVHLSWRTDTLEYESEGIRLYNELVQSNKLATKVQSQVALASVDLRGKRSEAALSRLTDLIVEIERQELPVNVVASFYQILGDVYSRLKNYKQAFESYDKSSDAYKKAMKESGLNVIDGLYHLYKSYGHAYSDNQNKESAVSMFEYCLDLASRFQLGEKKYEAQLDLGYHLILNLEFDRAASVLSEYYDRLVQIGALRMTNVDFVLSCLSISHWYSGKFLDAVHLTGLHIAACYDNDRYPVVSIAEGGDTSKVIEMFQKRILLLIIPEQYSIIDFKQWVTEVVEKVPELFDVLNDLQRLKKDKMNRLSIDSNVGFNFNLLPIFDHYNK